MSDASGTQQAWRDEEVDYCHATLTTIYQPTAIYEEYKETLTDFINNDITTHFFIVKW